MPEYGSWQQVLNTTEVKQEGAAFISGAETMAPPRSVLVFAGTA
jgi:glycogen operon protein